MAYAPFNSTAPNPPVMVAQSMAFGGGSTFYGVGSSVGLGGRLWVYQSTHLQTDVGTSDFIADGTKIGLRPNDFLFALKTPASTVSFHVCRAVGTTFASFSPGLVISSAS